VSLTHRPTVQTALACLAVSALQSLLGLVGVGLRAFALSLPLGARPWTLVTATYAHAGLAHLLANLLALLVVGLAVERGTTAPRFHAFFVASGALAGVAELLVGGLLGPSVSVIGASGGVFALLGYALTGNRLSDVLGRLVDLGRAGTLTLFVAVALLVTVVTASPGVALVAHFTGLLVGLLAGRGRLLHR
jgi:membrane associated rhomboid family serine protease